MQKYKSNIEFILLIIAFTAIIAWGIFTPIRFDKVTHFNTYYEYNIINNDTIPVDTIVVPIRYNNVTRLIIRH